MKPAIFLLENLIKEDIDWSFTSSEEMKREDHATNLGTTNDSEDERTSPTFSSNSRSEIFPASDEAENLEEYFYGEDNEETIRENNQNTDLSGNENLQVSSFAKPKPQGKD